MAEKYRSGSEKIHVNDIVEKYRVDPVNPAGLVKSAQNGISSTAFFDVLHISGLSRDELSGLLDISFKTVQRYENEGKKLNALNSEQLLKMITLYQKADEVFGTVEAFNRWLRKPAIGIGEQEPFTLMRTPGGIDLIYDELCRIEHGALA